jgi:hypothetical protein
VVGGRYQHPLVNAQLVVGVDERRLVGDDKVIPYGGQGPVGHDHRDHVFARRPEQDQRSMGIASRGSGGVARAVTSIDSVPSSHNATSTA